LCKYVFTSNLSCKWFFTRSTCMHTDIYSVVQIRSHFESIVQMIFTRSTYMHTDIYSIVQMHCH